MLARRMALNNKFTLVPDLEDLASMAAPDELLISNEDETLMHLRFLGIKNEDYRSAGHRKIDDIFQLNLNRPESL